MEEFELSKIFETSREYCEYSGHEWADMGGGMQICMLCETEREEPSELGRLPDGQALSDGDFW